ncbi:bile acid:sodium symporter family protein [Bacillus songklensis]|uniref:Bile acid:sodium symporter family protein n=1 Tax=Bacillus songklensis TaxID=1069116 RepID=A0ABV8B5G6_9BACI
MLKKMNHLLERAMPVITPASLVIGVLLADGFEAYAFLVPWIFAFMTFTGSLSSNFQALTRVISHPFSMFVALFILHIFMPLWAWVLGHVMFSGDMFTITGLFLAAVIPTGITSFIWVSIHKGNIPLALTIILIDTFLSPFIVPYSLSLVAGEKVHMDVWGMMQGLFFMVVLPSILGMVLNQVTDGEVKDRLGVRLSPFSKIGLAAVVMLNSAVVAPYLSHIDKKIVSIACVVFMLSFSGYLFSWLVGTWLKRGREEIVVLTFTGGMRNISAGAVLAVSYFPAAVAVPVVLGILFQQVLASFYGHMLHRYYHKSIQNNAIHGGM